MRFSVVIPCYNAQEWVGQALDSVGQQTRSAYEVIVVDDGSTDTSIEKIKSSPVVSRLLQTRRANGAGARNAGIKAATGDWVAFLDADDIWYPDHLQRAEILLRGGQDAGFINHFDHIDPAGAITKSPPVYPSIPQPTSGMTDLQYLQVFARGLVFVGMSACMIRRDVLEEIGGLDETQIRRHDIELWLRAIRGRTWAYDPVATTAYRITPGSISRNIAAREYYLLRAMLLNQRRYEVPEMDRLVQVVARRAMSAAYTDGSAEDRHEAKKLAFEHLGCSDKCVFAAANVLPGVFGWANRRRRKRMGLNS